MEHLHESITGTAGLGAVLAEASSRPSFRTADPATGQPTGGVFAAALPADVEMAARTARRAFTIVRAWDSSARSELLMSIAQEIDEHRDALIAVADAETRLGSTRLSAELTRASDQFRYLARQISQSEQGEIEAGDVAAPALTKHRRALGVVAVLGASNFPFAFSVLGGDVASALAVGCTVVVNGHPAHPGTAELSARVLLRALERAGAPAGTVVFLQGRSAAYGAAIAGAQDIAAIGFTGSQRVGRALLDAAARRPDPIPVFAEMGSLNPVVVTTQAVERNLQGAADAVATGLLASHGQYCTKPGAVAAPMKVIGMLMDEISRRAQDAPTQPLLHSAIYKSYRQAVERATDDEGLDVFGGALNSEQGFRVSPTLVQCDLAKFATTPWLKEEVFGPFQVFVEVEDDEALFSYVDVVTPALVGGVITAHEETERRTRLVDAMAWKVGRVVTDATTTGVAVADAQHHGGPYPACSVAWATAVGVDSMARFTRPVAIQRGA